MKKHMPRQIATLLIALSVMFSLLAVPASAHPFTDVSSTFWDEFISYVYDNDIMDGVSTTEFSPYSSVTRAMVVTALYQAEGSPTITYTGIFTDVSESDWYSKAIAWAASKNIVNGVSPTEFKPNAFVTRE